MTRYTYRCDECDMDNISPDRYHGRCGTKVTRTARKLDRCASCHGKLYGNDYCTYCGQKATDRKFSLKRWLVGIITSIAS